MSYSYVNGWVGGYQLSYSFCRVMGAPRHDQSLFKVNTHQGCLVLPAFIPFHTIKYWGDAGDQEARRSHSPVRCPGAEVVVLKTVCDWFQILLQQFPFPSLGVTHSSNTSAFGSSKLRPVPRWSHRGFSPEPRLPAEDAQPQAARRRQRRGRHGVRQCWGMGVGGAAEAWEMVRRSRTIGSDRILIMISINY